MDKIRKPSDFGGLFMSVLLILKKNKGEGVAKTERMFRNDSLCAVN
jgi:hypothetical protein